MNGSHWQALSEQLYYFQDTCNVYALVHHGEALLIDFCSHIHFFTSVIPIMALILKSRI